MKQRKLAVDVVGDDSGSRQLPGGLSVEVNWPGNNVENNIMKCEVAVCLLAIHLVSQPPYKSFLMIL